MKTALTKLVGICCAFNLCSTLHGQDDVTKDYLQNHSFEEDADLCTPESDKIVKESSDGLRGWNISPSGWNITPPAEGRSLLINKNCFTDNGFGQTPIIDGDFAYYQRFGWGSASSALQQETSQKLPAGEYELTFVHKAFAANNAASMASVNIYDETDQTLGTASFSCIPGSTNIMTNSEWTENSIKFILKSDSKIT